MPPRNSTTTTNPSSILSDALSSFTKAANAALAAVEDRAKADVARWSAKCIEAQRDRDEVVKVLHDTQMQEKEWERNVEGWKTSHEKAEITIKHQAETIVQLRAESSQWKSQLLRFEDASRREMQDWKDQYQRAEQERQRLSSRVDELLAEQLKWNIHTNEESTPYSGRRQSMPDPLGILSGLVPPQTRRAATATARASPSKSNPLRTKAPPKSSMNTPPYNSNVNTTDREHTYVDAHPPIPHASGQSGRLYMSKHPPRAPQLQQHERPSQPRTTLIRRVQAVIEVPVKEEDADDEELLSDTQSIDSSRASGSQKRPIGSRGKPKPTAIPRHILKARRPRDDDDYVEDHIHQDDDEDDDLLLIGAEDNHNESYVSRQMPSTSEATTRQKPRPSTSGNKLTNSAKKRKLDGDGATNVRATKSAKKK